MTNPRLFKVHTKVYSKKGRFLVISLIVHDSDHKGRLL